MLIHDNSQQCRAARTSALLERFNWELTDHLSYSPDLALSDYHLFTYLKNWLGSQYFNNNEELREGFKTWLSSQAADFIETGIHKLIS
jgi:histone-lysine N-methyltransferase SETMAR